MRNVRKEKEGNIRNEMLEGKKFDDNNKKSRNREEGDERPK